MTDNESDQVQCQANLTTNSRLDALEKQMIKVNADHKEFFDRIRAIEIAGAVQKERYDTIIEKLDNVSNSVETLNAAPGKRWNSAVDKVIFTVIGAVVAFFLAQFGM